MIDYVGGGAAVRFKYTLKTIQVKSDFVSFNKANFELISVDLILNGLKLRFLCINLLQNLIHL